MSRVQRRFEFPMPASCEIVFDAFHHHCWRRQWDTLVPNPQVLGGGDHPDVGRETSNRGAGVLAVLSIRTVFISYERPRVAAATMVGRAFPFAHWAASMRHRHDGVGRSVLLYAYSFEVFPRVLAPVLQPIVRLTFDGQTRRRFARLRDFLAVHAGEVEAWRSAQAESGS